MTSYRFANHLAADVCDLHHNHATEWQPMFGGQLQAQLLLVKGWCCLPDNVGDVYAASSRHLVVQQMVILQAQQPLMTTIPATAATKAAMAAWVTCQSRNQALWQMQAMKTLVGVLQTQINRAHPDLVQGRHLFVNIRNPLRASVAALLQLSPSCSRML